LFLQLARSRHSAGTGIALRRSRRAANDAGHSATMNADKDAIASWSGSKSAIPDYSPARGQAIPQLLDIAMPHFTKTAYSKCA
jgi:hypothetical protein